MILSKRITVLWLFAVVCVLRAAAQFVTGTVTEASSGDPLPFVYVYYAEDKNVITQTDSVGHYKIRFRKGTLVFSMMSYETKSVQVKAVQKLNVKLKDASSSLQEVVVTHKRKKYVRKDNPAVELMRKVIEAKKSTDLRQNEYLSYNKYEKMTTSVNDVTEKVFEDDHFKRFPQLKEHVEVHPETGRLILPLIVSEKVSQIIYRKSPRTEKSIVKGQREEGISSLLNTGDNMTGMLEDCITDVDIYKDQIRLLQSQFTSPVSTASAISFYRYFITDTLNVQNDKCYKVEFTPNNPRDFGFSGALYIMADSTWRVKRIEMGVPSLTGVNFIEGINIVQDFETLPTGEQIVVGDKTLIQFELVSWLQKLQIERVVKCSDWSFAPIEEKVFRFKGDVKVEPSASLQNNAFWNEHRPVPLSDGERSMDLFVKRLFAIKGFKPFLWVGKAFVENFVETSLTPEKPSKVDIGPVKSFIGGNSIEGFHLLLGGQTTANLNPHLFLGGYAKYGFGDRKWKGKGEVTYTFNKKAYSPVEYPAHNITFTYERDICSASDKFLNLDKNSAFSGLQWAPVKHMSYFERFNLLFDWEWENGLRFYTQVRRESNRGAGDLFYQPLSDNPLPVADVTLNKRSILFSEGTVGLSFQPGATYLNSKQSRFVTNHDAPIMSISHTVGMKGVMGGQYNYNFTEATIYKRFRLRSWGKTNWTLKGGVQWNRVPFPFLIMPAANTSYFFEGNAFCLMRNMEFPTDRYASLMASWDLNGKIMNRIPLVKRLKWREYIGVNCLWGQLTDKNNPTLQRNLGDSRLFYMPGHFEADGEFRYLSNVIDPKKPYVELVVGFHNVFRFFEIEYVRRFTYLEPGVHRWGVRGNIHVSF